VLAINANKSDRSIRPDDWTIQATLLSWFSPTDDKGWWRTSKRSGGSWNAMPGARSWEGVTTKIVKQLLQPCSKHKLF